MLSCGCVALTVVSTLGSAEGRSVADEKAEHTKTEGFA